MAIAYINPMSIYMSSDNFILIFFEKNPHPSQISSFYLIFVTFFHSEHSSVVVDLAFRIFHFPDNSSSISDVYTTRAAKNT